jgi:uncharacterized protein (DUF1697 family)
MQHVLLLRGVNVGARNRIAMPALRELLSSAGFNDVRTYMQSGNVVVSSDVSPEELASECARRVADGLGLNIDVIARTGTELAQVVQRNPLADVAVDPKRYQVSFCAVAPDRELVRRLSALAAASEQFVADGRELYAWHPDGVARSRLWAEIGGRNLGITATSRNWTTVTALLAMAEQ